MTKTNVAIFTIGTELTTGQITNTNASWLAEQLTDLQYNVVLHLSVADEIEDIVKALAFANQNANIIFVCGGLGPTTDDKTRDALARYWKKDQFFHQPSWDKIIQRIQQAGFPLSETNKRQCWYPEGSEVLPNPNGTADSFYYRTSTHETFVMPGPPHELKGIWELHAAPRLKARQDPTSGTRLKRWNLLGMSESVIGEKVETFTASHALASHFVFGYRPHVPYVELKIWYPTPLASQLTPLLQELRHIFAEALVFEDDNDIAREFLERAGIKPCLIIEPFQHGWLGQRLASAAEKARAEHFPTTLSGITEPNNVPATFTQAFPFVLRITCLGDTTFETTFQTSQVQTKMTIQVPYKNAPSQKLRFARFVTERAIIWWTAQFKELMA